MKLFLVTFPNPRFLFQTHTYYVIYTNKLSCARFYFKKPYTNLHLTNRYTPRGSRKSYFILYLLSVNVWQLPVKNNMNFQPHSGKRTGGKKGLQILQCNSGICILIYQCNASKHMDCMPVEPSVHACGSAQSHYIHLHIFKRHLSSAH